jgi:hypothetical protein
VGGDADEKINDLQKENSQKEKDNNKFQWYSSWLFSEREIGSDWTSKSIPIWDESVSFNNLNDANKEKIIEKINDIQDANRRNAFGSIGVIEFWGKKYEYKDGKFVQL